MEVGIDDGKVRRGTGDVERSCYCIHAPIHKALRHAAAVFHTHRPVPFCFPQETTGKHH
jgi:ribulose-5-phosphate 4-epimerase/fuculose-1-phosphate aldolase